MKRLLPALVLVSVTACGLADDERDEENKYIYLSLIHISEPTRP